MTSLPGPGGPGRPTPSGPAAPPARKGPLPSYPGRPPQNVAAWHRLHPLSPLVRSGRHLTSFVILLAVLIFVNARQAGSDFISDLVIVAVVLVAGVISWAVTRWRVDGGVLLIDTGLIRRQSRRFPLSQVQAIDVVQTGLARVFGLAEIRLRMAGADSSGGRLVALRLPEAQALRQQLLSMTPSAPAARATPAAPAGTAPVAATTSSSAAPVSAGTRDAASASADVQQERLVFHVRPGRLAVGLTFSITGLIAAVVVAGTVTLISVVHRPALTAAFLPLIVGAVIGVWRQFNGEYGTTVAVAADGPGWCRRPRRRSGPGASRRCGWWNPCSGGRSAGAASRSTWPGRASAGRTVRRAAGCARSSRWGPARTPRRCSPSWSVRPRRHRSGRPGTPAGRRR